MGSARGDKSVCKDQMSVVQTKSKAKGKEKTQGISQYFNHFPTSPTIPLISLNLGKCSIDLFMLNPGNLMISDDTEGLSEDPSRFAFWKRSRSRKAFGDSLESYRPEDPISEEPRQNRSNYLLTSRILFITYEPWIMRSMASLHSRVAKVMYLTPVNETGGCRGSARLPRVEG
ncbi:hypothetical protein BDM02DRAFT_1505189 [Thelephora ganbajun]|uniref:Uncharacterized protein n=1 Tax=Thelephora ganbajun TaxID=370292 RepID=A0ACB6Z1S7_THEGA|nr:hypothetical protein BDM02DRAFT_1505189 [Thelephora ganbajun]